MGPLNIYQSQEAFLMSLAVFLTVVVNTEEKDSSAVMTFPELSEMAEAIIKTRRIHFDYVYVLLEDEERLDSFSGSGEGSFRMVPTFNLELLINHELDEEYRNEEDVGHLSKIRNKMLVIWDRKGIYSTNGTFVLSALPKKYPNQELWILDSGAKGEIVEVMEAHPDSVPFTSQVYLFSRESGNDSVLVSEAYSLPGNAYGKRKPMLIVRELATYNFSDGGELS